MSVLFLDRAWWLYVSPDISMNRLIQIEAAIGPHVRERLIDLLRERLGMDDAA